MTTQNSTKEKHQILLDTDIGSDVDDALALLFALKSPEIELKGVTTVYGKTDIRAKIAKKILDSQDYQTNVPVCAGERIPMKSIYPNVWHTGREGDGILTKKEFNQSLEEMQIEKQASNFLINEITMNPGKYTLVTIGALTNIARALEREPYVAECLKHHYAMAGEIFSPNPEHNIACDVNAAQIVFNSSTPKTIIPLNITKDTKIARQDFNRLKRGTPLEKSVGSLVDDWFDYRDEQFETRVQYTCMHDPLTIVAITNPDLIETSQFPVYIDDNGVTKIDNKKGNQMDVGVKVNKEAFEKLFLDTIYK